MQRAPTGCPCNSTAGSHVQLDGLRDRSAASPLNTKRKKETDTGGSGFYLLPTHHCVQDHATGPHIPFLQQGQRQQNSRLVTGRGSYGMHGIVSAAGCHQQSYGGRMPPAEPQPGHAPDCRRPAQPRQPGLRPNIVASACLGVIFAIAGNHFGRHVHLGAAPRPRAGVVIVLAVAAAAARERGCLEAASADTTCRGGQRAE